MRPLSSAARVASGAAAVLALGLALATADPVSEEGFEISALRVYPDSIRLESARDQQRVVVMAEAPDGTHRDLTAEASFGMGDPSLARVVDGAVQPVADGSTNLAVVVGTHAAVLPLEVKDAATDPPASFRLDVLPVVTARGCNTGGCHGAARGQDGFGMSLFGFDPAGDYHRLTRELPGRRLDLAFPASSLLLEKPTGAVPHTGGKLFEPGSKSYSTLLRWIEEGARDDAKDVARVTGIELFPLEAVLAGRGRSVQLLVRASYSDGTDRDVTDLAVFRTNNEIAGAVDDAGRLVSGEPGEAFVTASFGVHTVGMPVVVLPEVSSPTYVDPADGRLPKNFIDELVETKHRKLRIQPSDLCTDEEFLRRVHLDVTGTLPTAEDREAFLADEAPTAEKRAALVDRLIARKEFSDLWVMQWAELLQIRSNNEISEKAALLYFEWIRDRIAENMPVDEMVRRVLTASGGTFTEPTTNFYQNERNTLVLAENVAQSFLGIRIQCAQCHNHPFDRWTQDDYYGFAAFFAQVGRKRAEDPREQIVFDQRRGEVRHVVGNRVMKPRFLGGEEPDIGDRDRREVLAQWLTAPDNPWFARSLANRVWAHFMGPGIIEPVDDFQVSNPPSNGPLLDTLGKRLVEYGYDFKRLVRDICTSRAYQRSTEATPSNATDSRNYARAQIRRLRAETLLDVVCQVTESPEKLKGLPLGARAVEIADGTTSNYFLSTFGRAPRETVCACEVSYSPTLSQALHLLNGDTIHSKIVSGGVIPALMQGEGVATEDVVRALYVRSLGREATAEELDAMLPIVAEATDTKEGLEDVFWALLNSREFLFQH